MKWFKITAKILFIFFILFSSGTVVEAEGSNTILCIGGYNYEFSTNAEKFDFSKLFNLTLDDLSKKKMPWSKEISNETLTIDGVSLNYQFVGTYNNNSALSQRCYAYKSITNEGYTYTSKSCASKYGDGTNFGLKFASIGNTDTENYPTNSVNKSNGTISLKITPTDDRFSSIWNRLKAVISYNGNSSVGSCSTNSTGKYIECTGIGPYTAKTSNGKLTNSPTYTISFYLSGITSEDFIENVTSEDKQSYIDSCGGSGGTIYLGTLQTSIMSQDQITVTNPKNTNQTIQNLCSQIDKIGANEKLKKAYVGECYNEEISYSEYLSQETTIKQKLDTLNSIFSNITGKTYKGLAEVAKTEKLLCTDNRMGIKADGSLSVPFESKIVYEDYEGYWGMICIEDYYVDGGVPSLVKAGMGVEYSNQVQINKTCYIFQLETVQKKEQCTNYTNFEIRCDHNGDGVFNPGDIAGGPTTQFDVCVESCDGGQYTQNCINSCYSQTYSDDRSQLLSKAVQSDFNFLQKYSAKQINNSNYFTSDAIATLDQNGTEGYTLISEKQDSNAQITLANGSVFNTGTNGYKVSLVDGNGNTLAVTGMSANCGATCSAFMNSYSGPPGCVNNAEEQYNNEVTASIAELKALETLAREESKLEEYSISFTDSASGYVYEITGNSNNNIEDKPQLDINKTQGSSKPSTKTYTIGKRQNGTSTSYQGLSTISMETVYSIELPLAHAKQDDAELIVVENPSASANKYYKLNKTTDPYTFEKYNSYKSALFSKGQKVFYTDFHSPFYNVLINSGKSSEELSKIDYVTLSYNGKTYTYELANLVQNIKVELKVGYKANDSNTKFESFDSTKFYCYYGVYQFLYGNNNYGDNDNFIIPSDGENNGDSPTLPTTVEGSDSMTSGLRYYYREIDLTDVFPNERNPRWNWTGTVNGNTVTGAADNSDSSYIVDPAKLIDSIEAKGDSVFTDESEYDYVFTMTPNIIREIRSYNKSQLNNRKITYLDFSLVSASNDKNSYSQKVTEWYSNLNSSVLIQISDCNNAKNGKC